MRVGSPGFETPETLVPFVSLVVKTLPLSPRWERAGVRGANPFTAENAEDAEKTGRIYHKDTKTRWTCKEHERSGSWV